MKVYFLGTAGDAVAAGWGVRSPAGVVVRSGKDQLHVDPGYGVVAASLVAEVRLREHIGVIISQSDELHAGGLNELLHAMSLGGYDPHGVLLAPKIALEGEDRFLHPNSVSSVERVVAYDSVPRVGINSFDVKIYSLDESALIQVSGGVHSVLFLDASSLTEEVLGEFRVNSMVLLEASEFADEDLVEAASRIDKVLSPRVLVLHRFSYNQIRSDTLALGRLIAAATSCPVVVAEDGLVIDAASYPIKRQ